jgi:hypothetical protein
LARISFCVFTTRSWLHVRNSITQPFFVTCLFHYKDSVSNGFSAIDPNSPLVAIHDAARPLVTKEEIFNVLADAETHGAI